MNSHRNVRIQEDQYQAYLADLMGGKRQSCAKLVDHLISEKVDLKYLYTELFQRSMYEIGVLWESNRISVATEHIATAITETLLPMAYPLVFSTSRIHRRVVVSCTPNEYHQIGAKMVADILEMKGWDTLFMGADTPVESLLTTLEDFKPELVCLSLSVFFNFNALLEVIQMVKTAYPKLPIIVGGQAFLHGGRDLVENIPGVTYASTLKELEEIAG